MTKSYSELLPSIERRLETWISLVDQRGRTAPQRVRPSITISRRFGCDAFSLAEHLKTLLDEASGETWTIFDRALLERVSRQEHLPMDLLSNLGGASRTVDSIGLFLAAHIPHDEAFRVLARYLVLAAQAGNAIVIGRGGAIVTQKLRNCYHFRLEASTPFCVAATMRRLNISEREATDMLREFDTLREKFIEQCLHASLSDLTHYHAVFNRERLGVEEIARTIVTLMANTWEDKSYFKGGIAAAGGKRSVVAAT